MYSYPRWEEALINFMQDGVLKNKSLPNFNQTFVITICLPQGFRIDLTCKQLTVDFVNQSVLQMSSHDVEGKRSDKTDFAERLGAMNRRWQILQGLIAEKVT